MVLFAAKLRLVEKRLVLGQQKRLHFADVAKIFVGHLEMGQRERTVCPPFARSALAAGEKIMSRTSR